MRIQSTDCRTNSKANGVVGIATGGCAQQEPVWAVKNLLDEFSDVFALTWLHQFSEALHWHWRPSPFQTITGIIRPWMSLWASPVVLVPKNYRRLNALTKKDVYPLPRIDDILDTLGKLKYFSSLDLASGYWQVELDEESRQKSAFITHCGLYEFIRMPFGLCNAPATFQRLMQTVLSGLEWDPCFSYIDDINSLSYLWWTSSSFETGCWMSTKCRLTTQAEEMLLPTERSRVPGTCCWTSTRPRQSGKDDEVPCTHWCD